jgi:hypothetical protein
LCGAFSVFFSFLVFFLSAFLFRAAICHVSNRPLACLPADRWAF